jgi:hypothetical protein
MKGKIAFLKIEKYFEFLKMDKKNVQNGPTKTLLTEKKTPYDVEKLWSQFKREEKIMTINFYYFLRKSI